MEKFRKYVDKKFLSYPKSRSLDELKEELIATLVERYNEHLANGHSEEDAFMMAIESIGDYKEAVNLIESGMDKKTKAMRRGIALLASAAYWLIAVTIFLTVSLVTSSWRYTWIIFPVVATLYLCITLAIVFPKSRSLGKSTRLRVSSMLLFLILTLAVYFLVSFFTRAWAITWVTFFIGISLGLICDAIIIRKNFKALFVLYVHLIVAFITSAVYQLISHFGIIDWSLSWLIYLFSAIGILLYNLFRISIKYKTEASFKG